MDRKGQLSNVAFGGAWSEQIAGNEALCAAMEYIEAAVARSADEDLREDGNLDRTLTLVAREHPKGEILLQAWRRALGPGNPSLRMAELGRITAAFRKGLGKRLI